MSKTALTDYNCTDCAQCIQHDRTQWYCLKERAGKSEEDKICKRFFQSELSEIKVLRAEVVDARRRLANAKDTVLEVNFKLAQVAGLYKDLAERKGCNIDLITLKGTEVH